MVVRLLTTMSSRDPDEPHRVATPLELFFDLTFVVAVAPASSTMHHLLVGGGAADALVAFPLVFFAIWWAWMNFTWFASAYDPDDAAFRLLVFAQMAGVLVFAAGVPRFLEDLDPSVAVAGYVIVAAMWWIYFDLPVERLLTRARTAFSALEETQSFVWGYGHYLIFASAAAVGVGLAGPPGPAGRPPSRTHLRA